MRAKASDFDELFVLTVLADLFDSSGSDDPEYVAQKIIEGLEENNMLKTQCNENNEPMAA